MKSPSSKKNNYTLIRMLKLFFASKNILVSLLSTILFLLVLYFTVFHQLPFEYFSKNTKNKTVFFDDKIDRGTSKVLKAISNNKQIGLVSILGNGFEYPYTGVDVSILNKKHVDVSNYNRIELTIDGNKLDHLIVNLHVEDKNVKNKSSHLTLRRVGYDFHVLPHKQTLLINLSDFETPNWWYAQLKQSKKEFDEPDLSKLVAVAFSPGVNQNLNIPITFSIYKIRFVKDNTIVVTIMGIVEVLFFIILFLNFYFKTIKGNPRKIEINYVPVVVEEKNTNDNVDFYTYIHENYADPELNLVQIAKHFGLNQRVISDSISQKYDCNFKTYINQFRINEAKRLMAESNLNISEIGYKVGFNSPTNFYRVFKTFTNLSPTEYLQSIVN